MAIFILLAIINNDHGSSDSKQAGKIDEQKEKEAEKRNTGRRREDHRGRQGIQHDGTRRRLLGQSC
jgi:hypothetical protein